MSLIAPSRIRTNRPARALLLAAAASLALAGCASDTAVFEEIAPAEELYADGLEILKGRKILGIFPNVNYDAAIETMQRVVEITDQQLRENPEMVGINLKEEALKDLVQFFAEEGDLEFYQQEFWAEAEGDAEYDAGAEDQAGDSFDSDFGDSTESDDDEDLSPDDEAEAEAEADLAGGKRKSQ